MSPTPSDTSLFGDLPLPSIATRPSHHTLLLSQLPFLLQPNLLPHSTLDPSRCALLRASAVQNIRNNLESIDASIENMRLASDLTSEKRTFFDLKDEDEDEEEQEASKEARRE
jgi:hypothetical protein